MGVYTGRLLGLLFEIGSRHGQGGVWEFVNDTDGPVFLERELLGLGVGG
jgi:hypothetical protein